MKFHVLILLLDGIIAQEQDPWRRYAPQFTHWAFPTAIPTKPFLFVVTPRRLVAAKVPFESLLFIRPSYIIAK